MSDILLPQTERVTGTIFRDKNTGLYQAQFSVYHGEKCVKVMKSDHRFNTLLDAKAALEVGIKKLGDIVRARGGEFSEIRGGLN